MIISSGTSQSFKILLKLPPFARGREHTFSFPHSPPYSLGILVSFVIIVIIWLIIVRMNLLGTHMVYLPNARPIPQT